MVVSSTIISTPRHSTASASQRLRVSRWRWGIGESSGGAKGAILHSTGRPSSAATDTVAHHGCLRRPTPPNRGGAPRATAAPPLARLRRSCAGEAFHFRRLRPHETGHVPAQALLLPEPVRA